MALEPSQRNSKEGAGPTREALWEQIQEVGIHTALGSRGQGEEPRPGSHPGSVRSIHRTAGSGACNQALEHPDCHPEGVLSDCISGSKVAAGPEEAGAGTHSRYQANPAWSSSDPPGSLFPTHPWH